MGADTISNLGERIFSFHLWSFASAFDYFSWFLFARESARVSDPQRLNVEPAFCSTGLGTNTKILLEVPREFYYFKRRDPDKRKSTLHAKR